MALFAEYIGLNFEHLKRNYTCQCNIELLFGEKSPNHKAPLPPKKNKTRNKKQHTDMETSPLLVDGCKLWRILPLTFNIKGSLACLLLRPYDTDTCCQAFPISFKCENTLRM